MSVSMDERVVSAHVLVFFFLLTWLMCEYGTLSYKIRPAWVLWSTIFSWRVPYNVSFPPQESAEAYQNNLRRLNTPLGWDWKTKKDQNCKWVGRIWACTSIFLCYQNSSWAKMLPDPGVLPHAKELLLAIKVSFSYYQNYYSVTLFWNNEACAIFWGED